MPSRARILIVSSGHPCRNPRPVKEAAALGAAGHTVTLLTPSPDPALATLDRELVHAQPFHHQTVPANHSFPQRLRQWLARRAIPLGLQSVHALGDPSALFRAARTAAADLTIVHNEVPHWIGARLLAEGRRVAADMEDWYSEDLLPAARRHRPLRLLRHTERLMLHCARYVTTTSDALADALRARYGGTRAEVITNAFPLQPSPASVPSGLLATRYSLPATSSAPSLNSQHSPLNSSPAFFWFSQTLGPGRGLERFLDAWNFTREPSRLVLLGEPISSYPAQLLARLSSDNSSRVTFRPLISPAALPALIAEHDIGLALEPAEPPNKDLTISNKILQYLNAGLAVVATDTAGQREVLARSPAAGILLPSTADASEYARLLDHLLFDRAALRARQQAARRLSETHYCWEQESPRLLALVEKALA